MLNAQEAERQSQKLLKGVEKFLKAGDIYSAIDNLEDYVDILTMIMLQHISLLIFICFKEII